MSSQSVITTYTKPVQTAPYQFVEHEDGNYYEMKVVGIANKWFKFDEEDIDKVFNVGLCENDIPRWTFTNDYFIGIENRKVTVHLHDHLLPPNRDRVSVKYKNGDVFDLRKKNLEEVCPKINIEKKERSKAAGSLPDGITQNLIPVYVYYYKPKDNRGDYFCVESKSKGIKRKTTTSKKISIFNKLREAVRILIELRIDGDRGGKYLEEIDIAEAEFNGGGGGERVSVVNNTEEEQREVTKVTKEQTREINKEPVSLSVKTKVCVKCKGAKTISRENLLLNQ